MTGAVDQSQTASRTAVDASSATNPPSPAMMISNLVTRVVHDHTGRGPATARTTVTEDLVTVVLAETLTSGELGLIRSGHDELVRRTREAFHEAMRLELITGVQQLTGRRVTALLSANHLAPDIAVHSFVLQPRFEDRCAP